MKIISSSISPSSPTVSPCLPSLSGLDTHAQPLPQCRAAILKPLTCLFCGFRVLYYLCLAEITWNCAGVAFATFSLQFPIILLITNQGNVFSIVTLSNLFHSSRTCVSSFPPSHPIFCLLLGRVRTLDANFLVLSFLP